VPHPALERNCSLFGKILNKSQQQPLSSALVADQPQKQPLEKIRRQKAGLVQSSHAMNAKGDRESSLQQSVPHAALTLHQLGDLANAEKGYRAILRAHPRHFDATYLLGLVLLQKGGLDETAAATRAH
jgi:TolA-binding protein